MHFVNSISSTAVVYDIRDTINSTHQRAKYSPIDEFISNGREINKLIVDLEPSAVLGNLVILGYISAVESYMRAIIRKLIVIDDISRCQCESLQVSYGSVLSNSKDMLPEALFEDKSLAGKKNIHDSLKSFLGLSLQDSQLPKELLVCLLQFDEICELRHCIVHRFGRFGSKNAIKLGLKKLSSHVEKPIDCNYSTLQNIILICSNTVRLLNNFLFIQVLDRLENDNSHISDNKLQWDFNQDKELFKKYFDIFYSQQSPPVSRKSMKKSYEDYVSYNKKKSKNRKSLYSLQSTIMYFQTFSLCNLIIQEG